MDQTGRPPVIKLAFLSGVTIRLWLQRRGRKITTTLYDRYFIYKLESHLN